MASVFDPETLEVFRKLSPRQAFEKVRDHVYRSGAATSDDFRDAFEELIDEGILTWEQVEEFEEG